MDAEIYQRAGRVGDALKRRGILAATAESCTGGWISQAITMVPGSSAWFDCGFVTYTNESKSALLGVDAETLAKHGAVSEQTVVEMVRGALARSRAHIAVAVSGVAGPTGGTKKKPVGTVFLAWALRDGPSGAKLKRFEGDRDAVRRQTVIAALDGILELLGEEAG